MAKAKIRKEYHSEYGWDLWKLTLRDDKELVLWFKTWQVAMRYATGERPYGKAQSG